MPACEETAGFLFDHACSRTAEFMCESCQKHICDKHRKALETRLVCVRCARQAVRDDPEASRRSRSWSDDDPYFYSGTYPGYGHYGSGYWGYHYHHHREHDPVDFTEGDSGSFENDGGDGFEQDMGAS